jgi:ABC-type nitrate/sulfonate/bicarbonate transport system substrate-binding protein
MASVLEENPVKVARVAATKEIFYSFCPVPVASHVAFELGWLEEELGTVGAKLTYLRSIPDKEGLWPHVSHRSDSLFRDGGNSPPIWARADVSDTSLIGVTFANSSGGQILVRADSDILRVADLAGRKVGLLRGLNTSKVDFLRAPAERGFLLALALAGLEREQVEFVDIEHDDRQTEAPSRNTTERLARLGTPGSEFSADVRALLDGRVDAVFGRAGQTLFLERTGKLKVIEDLGFRHPDWTLRANNTPYVLTVSSEVTRKHPEIVVAYLRASIRAGRWINANRRAAAEIFIRAAARYPTVDDLEEALGEFDFVPNLSPQSLAGVEVEKNFLLRHGYIKHDFSVADWADSRFLREAHASLE